MFRVGCCGVSASHTDFISSACAFFLMSAPVMFYDTQAFLDEHEELRLSASFGDVSAMVEHWMGLEDGMGDDEHLGLTSAFSF